MPFFCTLCCKALKNGQKELSAALKPSKSVMEERSLMIKVLISVKIYVLLVIYPFLLPGRLLTSFKPALRPDPLIRTWLGKKMPFYGRPDKFLKSEGRPGPIQTNLAQRRPDKNPIFGIRAFLLLPGVLVAPSWRWQGGSQGHKDKQRLVIAAVFTLREPMFDSVSKQGIRLVRCRK